MSVFSANSSRTTSLPATQARAHPFQSETPVLPVPRGTDPVGFLTGTRIATPMGYVAVERLSAGDMVLTADGNHARLLWCGLSRVVAKGAMAPVVFETGVMDNMRPLRLGPGHRLQVSGWRAELLFDAPAVLASARAFVNGEDVVVEEGGLVTYCHLLFERHEVVLAENVACESLIPGPEGLKRLDAWTRQVLLNARPGLFESMSGGSAALPCLTRDEAAVLLAA